MIVCPWFDCSETGIVVDSGVGVARRRDCFFQRPGTGLVADLDFEQNNGASVQDRRTALEIVADSDWQQQSRIGLLCSHMEQLDFIVSISEIS